MALLQHAIKPAAFLLLLFALLSACKGTKAVVAGKVDPHLATKRIIKNHYAHQPNFQTLRGNLKINYTNGDKGQTLSVNFRMEKDNVIWLTAPLGIAKARLTPNRVSFYNKLKEHYFEGDYSYLNRLLGAELDFYTLQNLILGNAMFDLRKGDYTSTIIQGHYQLIPQQAGAFFTLLFQIEPKHFKIAAQEIVQPIQNRRLQAKYTYQNVSGHLFPEQLQMIVTGGHTTTLVTLNFGNLEPNRPLNFPYKVPEGFDSITLK